MSGAGHRPLRSALPGSEVAGPPSPSTAERARTALAVTPTGILRLPGPGPYGSTSASVRLVERNTGSPVIGVPAGSPVVAALRRAPVATLSVRSAGTEVRLVAAFRPVPSEGRGSPAFASTLLFVAVGEAGRCHEVPVEEFRAAGPDPVAVGVGEQLGHWERSHPRRLLAWAEEAGYAAEAVVPLSVDRSGMELALLGAEGVRRVRLPHPGGPVADPGRVAEALGIPRDCRCDAWREG